MSASTPEPERSESTRERAERALVWLLHELGDSAPEIVLLGGLVPGILTSGQDPPAPRHLGTTDVDVLLMTQIAMTPESGSKAIEDALKSLGFADVEDGWRWRGPVDGVQVKIEFLCDIDKVKAGEIVHPQDCAELTAMNLRGTRYVAMDFMNHEIHGVNADGRSVTVSIRAAALPGYLLAKACALRDRALAKDYYDFAYVLIHNAAGGPIQAAELLLDGPLKAELPSLHSVLLEVRERYHKTSDFGPKCFAEESQKVDPGLDASRASADAVVAVTSFMDAIGL